MQPPPMLSVPADLPPRRSFSVLFAGVILLAAVGLALLYFHRPEGQFFFPRCTFHAATGLLCPGCGGLRATHALLHAEFAEALRCNALLVIGLPTALVYGLQRRMGMHPQGLSSGWVWFLFGVVVAFGAVRNLPIHAANWLCP